MIARYTRPELGAIWTDQAKMDAWRDVEVAAAEALDGPAEADLEAIRRATTSEISWQQLGRELGLSGSTVRRWVDAARARGAAPPGDESPEVRRLRQENAELREEREILKKATAFFAKYSK